MVGSKPRSPLARTRGPSLPPSRRSQLAQSMAASADARHVVGPGAVTVRAVVESVAAGRFEADLGRGVELCVPVAPYADHDHQTQTFGLPFAHAEPVRFGDWVAAVDAGASVNCPVRHGMTSVQRDSDNLLVS